MPENLRIAFATPEYVTESHFDGGLANYLGRVSTILASLGHDIHVVTLSLKDEGEFEHEGVMVHRVMLGRRWQGLNRLTRYYVPTTLHWLNFSAQVYRKLKKLHRQKPFHLIQYPNYSSCGVLSIPFLRAAHIVRASSYEPALNSAAGIRRNLDLALAEWLEVLQYRLASHSYAPSQAMRQTLATKAKMRDVALIRTPFYVENSEWDYTVYNQLLNGKEYLLYFGRFQLHKGFHILAGVLPQFLKRYPTAYAVLVGRDMETSIGSSMAAFAREQCGDCVARLIVIDNIHHSQLYPVIDGARLVVLPSLVDNMPNTCLEAMGLGKVVIGTNGAGFEELITDSVNGFLVPPNDSQALVEKMISAWIDPNLETIGADAKEQMLHFAPDKTIPSLLSYYSEVLDA